MLAIKTCKDQLKEKDKRIQGLTDQYKTYRQQSQREAQLMSSAIYEVRMGGMAGSMRQEGRACLTGLCE